MTGCVSPETCWASYKYEIKFWYTIVSCWIFYVNYTMMHGSTNIKQLLYSIISLGMHLLRNNLTKMKVRAPVCAWIKILLFPASCRTQLRESWTARDEVACCNVHVYERFSYQIHSHCNVVYLLCTKRKFLYYNSSLALSQEKMPTT
jgi:hypothetical protein